MAANPKLLQAITLKYVQRLPIRRPGEDAVITPILNTTCASIRASRKQTEKLVQQMDDEQIEMGYAAELGQEHEELVEELLGAAFVVLQRNMTAFSSRTIRVSAMVAEHYPITAPFLAKHPVFAFGTPTAAGHSFGIAVNAFANYYKHRDEPDFWTNPKHTAGPIVALYGLSANTADENMRMAAKALGAGEDDLWPLLDGLAAWSRDVTNDILSKIGAPLVV